VLNTGTKKSLTGDKVMDEKLSNEPVVGDASAEPLRGAGTRHSSRRHSSRSHAEKHKSHYKLVLPMALAVSVLALLLVGVFLIVSINDHEQEIDVLHAELTKTRQELKQVAPELQRAQKTLADMAKDRLPYLHDLVPDKVLNINNAYVKNVVFTVLNQNGTNIYEFKLVVENSSTRNVRPKSRMIVFDRNGVQIGGAEIADLAELAPGESRSQSAVIDRFIDAEPRYFYVSTMPHTQAAKLNH